MVKREARAKTRRKRTKRPKRKHTGGALAHHKPRLVDKIAEGVAMGLSGPAPTFGTAMGKLLSQAFKGVKKNVNHYNQRGRGIYFYPEDLMWMSKRAAKLPGWLIP